jgi:hypothetical protein
LPFCCSTVNPFQRVVGELFAPVSKRYLRICLRELIHEIVNTAEAEVRLQETYRFFRVAEEAIPDHAIRRFSRLTIAESELFLQAVDDLFHPTNEVDATRTGSDGMSTLTLSLESPPQPIHQVPSMANLAAAAPVAVAVNINDEVSDGASDQARAGVVQADDDATHSRHGLPPRDVSSSEF